MNFVVGFISMNTKTNLNDIFIYSCNFSLHSLYIYLSLSYTHNSIGFYIHFNLYLPLQRYDINDAKPVAFA